MVRVNNTNMHGGSIKENFLVFDLAPTRTIQKMTAIEDMKAFCVLNLRICQSIIIVKLILEIIFTKADPVSISDNLTLKQEDTSVNETEQDIRQLARKLLSLSLSHEAES